MFAAPTCGGAVGGDWARGFSAAAPSPPHGAVDKEGAMIKFIAILTVNVVVTVAVLICAFMLLF